MEEQSIRQLIDAVLRGQVRIPAFQRGFVWEPERIAYLMDSIYKGYPFGSLMFWRTREQLKCDKDLGPFALPDPKEDYSVDYVLDGQQRLTSIFGVFQSTLAAKANGDWFDIYFDLSASAAAQDTQFAALKSEEVDPERHFPLKTLFDSAAYRAASERFGADEVKKIDAMQERFKEARIPVQVSKTEDKATVAIIFERVNRQGVELDTLQLLSAWTWSEEFQLSDQFEELAAELSPFGFAEVGGDTDLLLRCCSGILAGDASPAALMQLNGGDVRARFDEVTNGVKHAIDYVKAEFGAQSLSNLPFVTLLVPLAVFFAVPGKREMAYTNAQRAAINRWFWRACFSKRYSSGVLRNLKTDIEQMAALRDGKQSTIGNFALKVVPDFFLTNKFSMGNVNTKTHILLMAKMGPRSFISGQPIDLRKTLRASNRSEFHHMMPKEFLKKSNQDEAHSPDVLANLCFLSRADNRTLGGAAPSEYRTKMPPDKAELAALLQAALTSETLFGDDFPKFLEERAHKLAALANNLCESA